MTGIPDLKGEKILTEGFEHLIEAYRNAGLTVSDSPCCWGYVISNSRDVTVIYMIMSPCPDEHGRVVARRWGYQDAQGNRTAAPGLIPTATRVSLFDSIEGARWKV